MLNRSVSPLLPSSTHVSWSRLLLAGVVCGFLVGCNAPESTASHASAVAENDVEVSPEPLSSKVSLASTIKVRFSATADVKVSPQALVVTAGGKPVEGQVVYSDLSHQLSFQPVAALQPNTVYTVTLATNGDLNQPKEWTFTTADDVGLTPQWVIDTCMTDDDIALLAAINRQRNSGGECGDQAFAPTETLEWQCDLAFLATQHAEDLVAMGVVGAMGSDGLSPVGRVTQAGIIWRGVAENELTVRHSDAADVAAASFKQTTQCQTLHNPRLTHMGAAVVPSSLSESVAVQLFIQQ